jgi:hypothetical protein
MELRLSAVVAAPINGQHGLPKVNIGLRRLRNHGYAKSSFV